MKKFKNPFLAILLSLVFLASCKTETETHTVETPDLPLKVEGPLFEGANTATATWEFSLPELLGIEGKVDIRQVKVQKVEIVLNPIEAAPELEKMVFEMTSKNTSMTRLGLYEGKITPGKPFELSVASQQPKLASAFQDERITFVGDFDLLEEEYWDDLNFTLKVIFEIAVRK